MEELINPTSIAQAMCYKSFINDFNDACNEAGGRGWEHAKDMTMEEFARIYGVNGIRCCYEPSRKVDAYMHYAEQLHDAAKSYTELLQYTTDCCQTKLLV